MSHIVQNQMTAPSVNGKAECTKKEKGVSKCKILLLIFMRELRINTRRFNQFTSFTCRDLKTGPSYYEAGVPFDLLLFKNDLCTGKLQIK
jgi:hypothetical protein